MEEAQPPGRLPPLSALRLARRVGVGAVGGSVILVGIAMIVLPGPAVVVIPAGLAILAAEFAWARRLLRRAKERLREAGERLRPAQRGLAHDADGGTASTETGASRATRRATLPRKSRSSP